MAEYLNIDSAVARLEQLRAEKGGGGYPIRIPANAEEADSGYWPATSIDETPNGIVVSSWFALHPGES